MSVRDTQERMIPMAALSDLSVPDTIYIGLFDNELWPSPLRVYPPARQPRFFIHGTKRPPADDAASKARQRAARRITRKHRK